MRVLKCFAWKRCISHTDRGTRSAATSIEKFRPPPKHQAVDSDRPADAFSVTASTGNLSLDQGRRTGRAGLLALLIGGDGGASRHPANTVFDAGVQHDVRQRFVKLFRKSNG